MTNPLIIRAAVKYVSPISPAEQNALRDLDPIRRIEVASIERFVHAHADKLSGRMLDYGAGKPGTCRRPQPYRSIVERYITEYVPFDLGDELPPMETCFDSILCTQVLNYVGPVWAAQHFAAWLPAGGVLVCTYPTCWDEVERGDYWRFTQAGVQKILTDTGFEILHHECRAEIMVENFRLPLGHGVVARKS